MGGVAGFRESGSGGAGSTIHKMFPRQPPDVALLRRVPLWLSAESFEFRNCSGDPVHDF